MIIVYCVETYTRVRVREREEDRIHSQKSVLNNINNKKGHTECGISKFN